MTATTPSRPASALPPPEAVYDILIWHQGALGDLLLAASALSAISCHFPQARLTALGHPERWQLLASSLPLAEVWDSRERAFAPLYGPPPLPAALRGRLRRFDLAFLFSPRPRPDVAAHLSRAGIARVLWLPSFPVDGRREPVAALQARHLAEAGLHCRPEPFRLAVPEAESALRLPEDGPWLAVAPGSGNPRKNWPLSHYYEVSRALAWQHGLRVVWLAGPAEEGQLPYIKALAQAQGHLSVCGQPLARVAAVLRRCRLYIGGDSGLTHLAAAVGRPRVLALFGPTDPVIWAPRGARVRVLNGPCPSGPCTRGREIDCPEGRCLKELLPDEVLRVAAKMLEEG